MSTDVTSPKGQLLNRAAREYKAFHEAIQGLNEEHMTEVWLGSWSIRDVVGHVTGWHREMAPALERITRGERPVLPGVWRRKDGGFLVRGKVTDPRTGKKHQVLKPLDVLTPLDARAWLFSEHGYSPDGIFSVENICDNLGVDLRQLRQQARARELTTPRLRNVRYASIKISDGRR